MKKCTSIVMALIAMVLLLTGCPHPVSGDEPDVMVLTLDYSGLSRAADVDKVTVKYGWAGNDAGDEHYAQEVTATISGYKATVECDKTYAKPGDWVGFDHTKIKLLDASGNAIACRWNADWFEYDEDGVTLTASDVVSEKATLTLRFTGFEIPGGSVSVHYGADDGTYVDATATVAEDGKSATVLLDKQYTNNSGWFNGMVFTVKDDGRNEISGVTYTNYCEYNKDGMSLELIVDSADYIDLDPVTFENKEKNSWIDAKAICDITATISQLKITVSNVTGYTWMCYGSCWVDSDNPGGWIGNLTDEGNGTFTATITDSTHIAKLQSAGIIVYGGENTGSGTVTVSYVAAN